MAEDTLLVQGIGVQFEGLVALDDVSFDLHSHEICGLIGPNGAGKTTLVNVLTGFQKPSAGRVVLGTRDVTAVRPELRARMGIARTFQAVRLFRSFSVLDNLMAAAVGVGTAPRVARDRARRILGWMKLAHLAHDRADSLPYGLERRVGIARALAADPRFLLLDEPAAGLNDSECEELMDITRAIPEEFGAGVLLIEHNMHVVMNVCHRVCVIDFGRKIAEGTPDEIKRDRAVRDAYLGADA